ncbi:MAG: pyruvate kinase, partial [Woeseiaceae bacterium]|nr:pyruvate kinase [Woeseiaceae bacterium]
MTRDVDKALVARLLASLYGLRDEAIAAEAARAGELGVLPGTQRASACNLIHYLAIRRHDIRPLQLDLMSLGLASLGICESHVLASLDRVIEILELLNE